jgi:hypothetical protein
MRKYFQILFLTLIMMSCQNSHDGLVSNSDTVQNDIINEGGRDGQNYNQEEINSENGESQNNGQMTCPFCNGTGEQKCTSCSGRGRAHCSSCGGDGWSSDDTRCLDCDGRGIVSCNTTESCPKCNGNGFGYLIECPLCHGSLTSEDGSSCICTGSNFFATAMINAILGQVGGSFLNGHPGKIFTYQKP